MQCEGQVRLGVDGQRVSRADCVARNRFPREGAGWMRRIADIHCGLRCIKQRSMKVRLARRQKRGKFRNAICRMGPVWPGARRIAPRLMRNLPDACGRLNNPKHADSAMNILLRKKNSIIVFTVTADAMAGWQAPYGWRSRNSRAAARQPRFQCRISARNFCARAV